VGDISMRFGGKSAPARADLPTRSRTISDDSLSEDVSGPWQDLLNGLSGTNALVAIDGTILFTNEAWVRANRVSGLAAGANLVDYLMDRVLNGNKDAPYLLDAWSRIVAGEQSHYRHRYAEYDLGPPSTAEVRFFSVTLCQERFVVASGSDLTEITQLKRRGRQLGSAVLQAQERERRRIARELHDSTSQLLTTLRLDLSRLRKSSDAEHEWIALLDECTEALNLAQREIRALSYVYHPPSLEGRGLTLALKTMADGFARRTGIAVNFQVDGELAVSPLAEATLYRLAQEALTNVHRHARATKVDVHLVATAKYAHLIIRDNGIGTSMALHAPIGVGISGMRERFVQIGGRLTIKSSKRGTTLTGSLRREIPSDAAPEEDLVQSV